jgi:hypothetical protein
MSNRKVCSMQYAVRNFELTVINKCWNSTQFAKIFAIVQANCLLPTAYCILLSAYCLLLLFSLLRLVIYDDFDAAVHLAAGCGVVRRYRLALAEALDRLDPLLFDARLY